jgi:4,5-dihydroxyphthalate decarboxylase
LNANEGLSGMTTITDNMTLNAMFGPQANVAALKDGRITSPLVRLDCVDVKVANTMFKALVRDQRFDVAELAIVTFLQAKAYGKPYVLLPAVVVGRGQHHTIAYNPERGPLRPSDLNGKRVGVRAYTQTTGAWVRGILNEDYGVDLARLRTVTFEDAHLSEYRDPDTVERAPAGKELVPMLLAGEIDAAIIGDKFPDARLKPLIPDAESAAAAWAARHGGVPINHMVVVRESIAKSRPDVVREIFRMLLAAKQVARLPDSDTARDPLRFGVEANRKSLEIIIDYALRQKLIPRRFSVDELFDENTRALAP